MKERADLVPAFSDLLAVWTRSASKHTQRVTPMVSLDSAKDSYEITQLKITPYWFSR